MRYLPRGTGQLDSGISGGAKNRTILVQDISDFQHTLPLWILRLIDKPRPVCGISTDSGRDLVGYRCLQWTSFGFKDSEPFLKDGQLSLVIKEILYVEAGETPKEGRLGHRTHLLGEERVAIEMWVCASHGTHSHRRWRLESVDEQCRHLGASSPYTLSARVGGSPDSQGRLPVSEVSSQEEVMRGLLHYTAVRTGFRHYELPA